MMACSAASSSTTSTVSEPRAGALGDGASRADAGPLIRGRKTLKVVPRPTALSIARYPPACLTMPYTVARPSPVPSPGSFVVKKGSKMWGRTESSIPQPESATERST
jgi:hypothetical protein